MQDHLNLSQLEKQLSHYSLNNFKEQFPALKDNNLIYFDSAATSLRPQAVLDAFNQGYGLAGNVERSLHTQALTDLVQAGKQALVNYLDPENPEANRLTYTQNSTESLNLLAQTLGEFWEAQQKNQPQAKYYILVTQSNHHANLLPWIKLCHSYDFLELKTIPLLADLSLDLEYLRQFCQEHSQELLLVSLSAVDNANGMVHPIGKIKEILSTYAPHTWLSIDNAQGSCFNAVYLEKSHSPQGWQADFLVGSLHKMFGLTGIGYLYISPRIAELSGKQDKNLALLAKFFNLNSQKTPEVEEKKLEHLNIPLPGNSLHHQWVGGGFVKSINLREPCYQLQESNPFLVSGTPNINALVTVASNLNWLTAQPLKQLYEYTHTLQKYFLARLASLPQVANLSQSKNICQELQQNQAPVVILPSFGHHISLSIEDGLDIDLGQFLAQHNVVARVGKHCAYPYHEFLGVDSTLRFSLAPFNTKADVDTTIDLISQFLEQNL
ncbi:hypothetical protein CJP74_06555 [Psittacicella melopsittaci]|uniref:Aminotransferase class V domain-containing protein n=1 Tax=Psittacicella melopsittaci TaxID=2028576 RepID=A0A3A1Y3D6_9GAMM|nr:aminotransferase class V-fold PLP-dependent enzyme [Psittacicella melopsittaci]RIY31728.1 hypothetical protein CJP74_06555 [Psittacicella melopsittaci]